MRNHTAVRPNAVRRIVNFGKVFAGSSEADDWMDSMDVPYEFETQRLSLRQWKAVDREPFAALNADPMVMAHFPAPLSRAQSDAMADLCERLIATRRWGAWATEIRATGEFIGFVGLHVPRDDLPTSPCIEILWRLAHPYWHKGYATEAARGALHVGFEVLGLPEIVSFVVPSNTRSRAVMERLGMMMDPATFEHPGLPEGHVLRTHCIYRLSRKRWLAGRVGRRLDVFRLVTTSPPGVASP